MVNHYIKVAFRNLAKYKTQNIISIVSIGVSVAIFAIVSLFMLNGMPCDGTCPETNHRLRKKQCLARYLPACVLCL